MTWSPRCWYGRCDRRRFDLALLTRVSAGAEASTEGAILDAQDEATAPALFAEVALLILDEGTRSGFFSFREKHLS